MYAGFVGWYGVPSWPIAVASPAALFTTIVATAPAVSALRIFCENVHEPREISAILPARLPAGRAEHAWLRAVPSSTTPSGAARVADTVAKSPATPGYAFPPTLIGAATKGPTVKAPAVSARSAEPGDSTVKWPGPLLPAAT